MKRLIIFILLISIVLGGIPASSDTLTEESIALHVGSPLILHGEDILTLDSANPNVVPVIHKDRTLVPLRAIGEHFGAEVNYDGTNREAIIKYNGKTYYFPIGKSFYRVEKSVNNVQTISFDTESLIIEERTMVPLRVIAENILNKKVGYSDRVISIGSTELDLNSTDIAQIKSKIGQALKVSSATELKALVSNIISPIKQYDMPTVMPAPTLVETPLSDVSEMPVMENSIEGDISDKSNDFSNTNEQVEGVNEADIIKTDGEFIYVATGKSVKIYRANNGKPVLTDEIQMTIDEKTGEYIQLTEMYIDSGRLVILGEKNVFHNWIRPLPETEKPIIAPDMDNRIRITTKGKSYTYLGVYSISSNGKASLMKELELEGNLLSSRKKDDTVYLIVNQYLNYYEFDNGGVIPLYRDSVRDNDFNELPVSSIMYYPGRRDQNYLMVAAVDIKNAKTESTIEAFLGSGTQVYMSNNALYVSGQDYNTIWGTITNITKFNVDGMKIGFAGGGMVEGYLLNQFSMDEHNGNLRVATTNWKRESINAVYVLDKNLNQIGSVENLAPGETIYSVRFMGDMGYVVTFRQIDPLFVIDLSNPSAPKVVGELKIPGFSNYLHPIAKDKLLGIGQSIDEKTGRQDGIKLSIFDVSDSSKPREINNLILGSSGSYADVLNNHKALMLNLDDDMIGFTAQLSSITGKYEKGYFNGAIILEVKENGDMKVLNQISNNGIYGSYVDRLIYIGDVLYYVQDDLIRSFNMDTFQEIK